MRGGSAFGHSPRGWGIHALWERIGNVLEREGLSLRDGREVMDGSDPSLFRGERGGPLVKSGSLEGGACEEEC